MISRSPTRTSPEDRLRLATRQKVSVTANLGGHRHLWERWATSSVPSVRHRLTHHVLLVQPDLGQVREGSCVLNKAHHLR